LKAYYSDHYVGETAAIHLQTVRVAAELAGARA
jgi:hypothetical protein